ncbi:energy-coupling factor transporter transmembrane protein EcfT [Anaerotruncus massiliensis (ex Togo et al. 2019)]|uniref:energy-coupling factor transporter transmembrane component T family protein n=1 Tax=Anaerotruncus TaxID=244127 RepID=UPI000C783B3A|nr:energy-coupling factor transporter transmembrane component T [Anaerotruncus massiliensis (ex Togo et al. 2019)]
MLKDITIGQYFPGTSPIHRLDPRMKIVLTVAYIILLFTAQNAVGLAVGVLFLVLVYGISKIPPVMILRSLKPVVPIIVFTSVLNMFFIDGRVLFQWWILKLTAEGVKTAVFMSVRIVCLIAGTSLLTYTTSPIALTDGIERLCNPLKRFKLPVHELAMMMTIALRFIPTLIEETDKIMSAQKARGADLESGGLMQRARALIPILIPLFVSAFRRADELALAMECRCYRGGEGRTRMKQLKIHPRDVWSAVFVGACLVFIVLSNLYGARVLEQLGLLLRSV